MGNVLSMLEKRAVESSPEEMDEDEAQMLREELLDADIGASFGQLLLTDPKMRGHVEQAAQSPGAAGLMAAQTLLGIRDKFIEKGIPHSPRIWTAENGVLRSLMDDLEAQSKEYGVPMTPEVKDQAYAEALKVLMQYDSAGKGELEAGQNRPPQAGAPAGPEGSPPNGGGGALDAAMGQGGY